MREFRDTAGVGWVVFRVARGRRSAARDQHLPVEYREGWLAFESERGEKRRLAPVPEDWEALSDPELETLCSGATPHLARTKAGQEPVPAGDRAAADVRAAGALPQLKEIETRLYSALAEVCELPKPDKLDTGELVRVRETLALATEAAQEAVSLRRKIRADRERKVRDSGDTDRAGGNRHA